jgi:ubiquitin carboxyl-terminal hydrolase 8
MVRRAPAESSTSYTNGSAAPLARRPAIISRGNSTSNFSPPTFSPPLTSSATLVNGHSNQPITYPSFNRRSSVQALNTPYSPSVTVPTTSSSNLNYDGISPPPVAVSPSLSLYRRNSRGFDRSDSSMPTSGTSNNSLRSSTATIVEYPTVLRPPPPAAASPLAERQDNRPRQPVFTPGVHSPNTVAKLPNGLIKPPRIPSDYPVTYWSGIQIATTGLKNLGNTCYMNATIQCLSATVPFARFFNDGRWKTAINYHNSLGTKGHIAMAFATILHELWHGDLPYITPFEFRKSMGSHKSQYATSDQQDSQEFLSFLLDGIHEDLNRVISKPNWTKTPAQEAELETLLPQIASEQEWMLWQTRNDSIIVDFFQGQLRNRLKCSTCGQTSTTYNAFSLLQLPIPSARGGKVPLQKCFEAYCNREIMEGDDAWDCPKCKTKRKATKELSLSRLPPILIIHLKRFESNGRFSDKMDTLVDFPLQSLDLTDFMPGPLPSGADKRTMNVISPEDPRTQIPPYRYDLYGVTNHYGNLTSGHYTAFVASRGGWMLCDDSSVRAVDAKQVVNQRAYVLFYKRTKV